MAEPDLTTMLGPLRLANPIVAASGTFGHGAEFARICPPRELGAMTVKSLAWFAHAGNPPLRTTSAPGGGMLNSVGLSGAGVAAWAAEDLPALEATGATVIVSIWGRSIDDYARAAREVQALAPRVAALEVNLSCPNLGGHEMFAQSPTLTAEAIRACSGPLPVFAKLSAQVTDIVSVASAALDAGATGLTLVNTMPGLVVDIGERRTKLGAGGGGLSGPPLHAIALRCVADVARALPGVPIIGTGGVSRGSEAVAMLLAGATAVGVGTATFAEPRATLRIRDELSTWCRHNSVRRSADLTGGLRWPT